MKKVFLTFFITLIEFSRIYCQSGPTPCNDYVTVDGKYFKCGGQPYYPLVTQYIFSIVHFNQFPVTEMDYFLSRSDSYGPCTTGCNYDSYDETGALTEINNDFAVIHQMGFNAIRTTGIGPVFEYPLPDVDFVCPHPPETFIQHASWPNTVGSWEGTCMPISTNPAPDPYRERLFYFIRQILEKAHANSLKVLLDVAYDRTTKDTHVADYISYLEQLALYVNSLPLNLRQTLMAYVIVEEPFYESQTGNNKNEVCVKVKDMYGILHTTDPQHLITIGGTDFGDVMEWDPGVMKLDFWSPHVYFKAKADFETNSDQAVQRALGQVYWYKNTCPMPWMIGETSFGATDDEVGNGYPAGAYHYPIVDGELGGAGFPPINGEYYTQQTYAHDMLKMVRDCGGNGFSWWQFQELWWAAPPLPDINGNNYGLLRHGEAITEYNTLRKPVVDEFETYLDATGQPPAIDAAGGQMPASYYNPYLFNNSPYTYTGTVKEEGTTSGIKDAVIWGWTKYYKSNLNPLVFYQDLAYTFTLDDGQGSFNLNTLNPNAIFTPTFEPSVERIEISAVGAERENYGLNHPNALPATPNPAAINCELKISKFNYDLAIDNETVNTGTQKNFKGWNSLTVSNTTVQTGATADFTARNEVHLTTEFNAANGSEAHIYTATTFPDCNDYTTFLRLANPNVTENIFDKNSEKEIEIHFTPKVYAYVNVTPNPNNGIFTLELTTSEEENDKLQITVFDFLGNKVYSTDLNENKAHLNLSNLAKGIYFVRVKSNNNLFNKKIIIQ